MPKNKKVNGFWFFSQQMKPRLGLQGATNEVLLAATSKLWKGLSPEKKKEWDCQAKGLPYNSSSSRGLEKRDNKGDVISTRQNMAEDLEKMREEANVDLIETWQHIDLKKHRLYMIDFQDMCPLTFLDNTNQHEWLPREVALLEYTLQEGITNTYHQFIWPTEATHKIPVEQMQDWDDSDDFYKIWRRVLSVMTPGVVNGRYPPLFCPRGMQRKVRYLCDWLWEEGRVGHHHQEENPLKRIYCLEDMVQQLLSFSDNPDTRDVDINQIEERLNGFQWDYVPNITCDFHYKVEVSRYCSLAVVRKHAYTISDIVCVHYGVELSERHVPVRSADTDSLVEIVQLSTCGLSSGRKPPGHAAPDTRVTSTLTKGMSNGVRGDGQKSYQSANRFLGDSGHAGAIHHQQRDDDAVSALDTAPRRMTSDTPGSYASKAKLSQAVSFTGHGVATVVGGSTMPVSVGEGVTPMSVGRGVSPMSVGRGVTPMSVGGGVTPMSVGRGVAPMWVGRGVAPMSVGRGAACISVGRGVPMRSGDVLAPASMVHGNTRTSTDSSNMPVSRDADSGLPRQTAVSAGCVLPSSSCEGDSSRDGASLRMGNVEMPYGSGSVSFGRGYLPARASKQTTGN